MSTLENHRSMVLQALAEAAVDLRVAERRVSHARDRLVNAVASLSVMGRLDPAFDPEGPVKGLKTALEALAPIANTTLPTARDKALTAKEMAEEAIYPRQ